VFHEEVEETEGGNEGADDAVGGRQRKDQQHPERDFKRDLKWWKSSKNSEQIPLETCSCYEQFIKLNLWQRDAQKPGHWRIGHTKKTSEQYNEGNI
jgi:hypothetical protein